MSDFQDFETIELAQDYAARELPDVWQDHAYVYLLKSTGLFGLHWHSEDRYVQTYLPFDAKILMHGIVKRDANHNRHHLEWEKRGTFSSEDREMFFAVLGKERGQAFMEMLENDDDSRE